MPKAQFVHSQRSLFIWFALLALLLPWPAKAQQSEWQQLNQMFGELYKQGNYKQAAIVADQSLSAAEKSLGAEHLFVATSLNNLAAVYLAQGQYAQP